MKDFHIHTIYSDGEDNEFEIIEKIKDAGIKEFAICDHNIITGCKKVHDILKKSNSDLIFHTGIEFTCRLANYSPSLNMHIIVHDFDLDSKEINYLIDKYEGFKDIKLERMIKIVKKLYDFDIPEKDIIDVQKKTASIGKPHIYNILINYMDLSREQYYKDMDNLDTDDLKLDVLEVIEISNKIGSKVVLAHPIEIMEDHGLTFDEIDKLVGYLKEKGLDSIETRHSKHNEEYYNKFHSMAIKYNLEESMGSDYHGYKVKPNVKLGKCYKE